MSTGTSPNERVLFTQLQWNKFQIECRARLLCNMSVSTNVIEPWNDNQHIKHSTSHSNPKNRTPLSSSCLHSRNPCSENIKSECSELTSFLLISNLGRKTGTPHYQIVKDDSICTSPRFMCFIGIRDTKNMQMRRKKELPMLPTLPCNKFSSKKSKNQLKECATDK